MQAEIMAAQDVPHQPDTASELQVCHSVTVPENLSVRCGMYAAADQSGILRPARLSRAS
jgi:hypothetical protein